LRPRLRRACTDRRTRRSAAPTSNLAEFVQAIVRSICQVAPQQMDGRIDMEAIGEIIDRITDRIDVRYRAITEGPDLAIGSFSDGSGKERSSVIATATHG